jgi:CHRD domain
MASFSIVKTGSFASLGMIALLGGCGGDDSNTCGPASAVKTFTVTLMKAAEVPPCAAAGANAAGSATVTVSADACEVQVSNFTYSGLSGPAGAAHIHFGVPGANGNIVLGFSNAASPINAIFTSADYQAASGAPADFAAFIVALRAGGAAYIHVHTTTCPPGEIRGEIQ